MFRMQPRHLVRWGAGLAALGNLIIAFAPSYWAVVAGYALASLGYGFCRPGFTAGASLSVQGSEQARAAGAIAAINGSSVVLAPVLGVWLYEQFHPAQSDFADGGRRADHGGRDHRGAVRPGGGRRRKRLNPLP
jgi:MFS family permease